MNDNTYIHYISNDCKFKLTFIQEKHGLARWDYNLIKDGKEVVKGVDVSTVSFEKKDAIIEILSSVIVESGRDERNAC